MSNTHQTDPTPAFGHGLNRVAVFELEDLPSPLLRAVERAVPALHQHRQLVLVAHAGKAFWQAFRAANLRSEDPVDDFTTQVVRAWFAQHLPKRRYQIVYPGADVNLSLQALGELAGFHHASPFWLGIDPVYGTWSAYRAVIASDTSFPTTEKRDTISPCSSCTSRICVTSCPPGAMNTGAFEIERCIDYRLHPDSACRTTCVARVSCPVGAEHRYDDEQTRYHYGRSLRTIEQMQKRT